MSKRKKIPDYRGELAQTQQQRRGPLPGQLQLFDRALYVPVKKDKRPSNR